MLSLSVAGAIEVASKAVDKRIYLDLKVQVGTSVVASIVRVLKVKAVLQSLKQCAPNTVLDSAAREECMLHVYNIGRLWGKAIFK